MLSIGRSEAERQNQAVSGSQDRWVCFETQDATVGRLYSFVITLLSGLAGRIEQALACSATSIDRGIPSAEVAAQLSSPDAFNRASSSHPNLADDKRRHLSSQVRSCEHEGLWFWLQQPYSRIQMLFDVGSRHLHSLYTNNGRIDEAAQGDVCAGRRHVSGRQYQNHGGAFFCSCSEQFLCASRSNLTA